MEPGVPFALLGAGLLLAVAAWGALAATAVALRDRTRTAPAALLVAGALLLAAVDTRTALLFGRPSADLLALARAVGLLLAAAGLALGAVGRPEVRSRPAAPLPGVVVPLAAGPVPSAVVVLSALAAAAGALRARRDAAGLALAGAFLVTAAAGAAGRYAADSPRRAAVEVLLRAAAAVAVLAALALLARTSLLAKVVAAILAGVLAMAAAAVGVVGTVVVSSYDAQARDLVAGEAAARQDALERLPFSLGPFAPVLARVCPGPSCAGVAGLLGNGPDFAAVVPRTGPATGVAGRAGLSRSELLALRSTPVVAAALARRGTAAQQQRLAPLPSLVRLTGARPGLAAVTVVADGVDAGGRPTSVLVYGVRVDRAYADADSETGGFGFTVLVGDTVVASNRPVAEQVRLRAVAARAGVVDAVPSQGRTVPSQGADPTVRFVPLRAGTGRPVAVLAVSRDAAVSLAAERRALRALLLTALGTVALVGGLAVLLGRRTVAPVRRLTEAAARIGAGDLSGSLAVSGRDEVGTLARTFDAMTGSLSQLTGDLREAAARLATVLSSMSDGLLATDQAGLVTSANPAALALVGLASSDDAVGRPLREVVHVRDAAGRALADPSLVLADEAAEVHRPDGSTVPVRVALHPLEDGAGVVLVLRDTTREREVERMKTEFLSNVSHELRTPLTPIRGYADLLVTRPGLPAESVAQFAGTIRDESVRMGRVVDLLVDVAALEAGRVQVAPRPVGVRALLDERLAVWRARAPGRAGDLRRRVAAGLPEVLVDPEWVGKALDELLDNAVKHTPPGTSVVLGAAAAGDRVRVYVRDDGPGIPRDAQGGLFTSFEQVDGSATRRVGGLGLGLSFVRRLAEDAGYPLTVTSEPGAGAEFALHLPAARAPAG
jgi:PAS domain S-box-containing protein